MPTTSAVEKQNLSADDWAQAALDAIAAGGMEAAAVEPLARELGVTKGSFYWHFDSRDALVKSALKLWERQTEALISEAQLTADPYARIVKLFKRSSISDQAGRLHLALAASDDARASETVSRVGARRLWYLQQCYRALGLSEREAQHWSTFAYATFIGNQQVHRDAPERFADGARFHEYFSLMVKTLIPTTRA